MRTDRIIVGVDLSPGCLAAVDWSVHEARRRGAVLVLMHGVRGDEDAPGDAAGDVLAAYRGRAHAAAPDVDVRLVITRNPPATALVEASEYAGLLVLGSRGRAGFTDSALGSVAQQVIVHAACPVVVVPPDGIRTGAANRPGRIVAGLGPTVDVRLLECAAELAWVHGATLHLVPAPGSSTPHFATVGAAAYLGRRYPGVPLDLTPVTGDEETRLTRAARDAELLVVSCRHTEQEFACRTGDDAARALLTSAGPVVLVGAEDGDQNDAPLLTG